MLTSTLRAYHPPMLPGLSDVECHLFLINRAAENVVYLWVSLLEIYCSLLVKRRPRVATEGTVVLGRA